ncbi:hypothetical protein ES288_D02G119300v1 [Gossypium darwinii]|uniref:Galactose oxidase-like Early set domain-containing protein n=1 Tax=Gossypium darwinii TaxID=34276 RepID=A0A5D2DFW6_GOSDA|nr:hypothetical protein ES288_D02G119300v1 [Gossypium darwinii]
MSSLTFILSVLLFQLLCTSHPCQRILTSAAAGGRWQLLQKSIGISAMHMQLLSNDRVFRPLMVQTDVWCSSGAVTPNGDLVQTGGFNDGERKVRVFSPCSSCDWQESNNGLAARRWYSTNHILPDGRQIIVGGRKQFNYEFVPKNIAANTFDLPFLFETNDREVENNLYPFVFLNVDGNLFVFANNRAILLDYVKNKVVKRYPTIPGGDPRSYPSTGSAVLLPLKNLKASAIQAEVLVCGGAPKGSYSQATQGEFIGALKTCARIIITDPNPKWVIETMPLARVMGDMILLPNGNVLLINGAGSGSAGWEFGPNPVLNPVLYRTDNKIGTRFETHTPTKIPRMYHSTAALLRDGRVLVGGSNPHTYYNFTSVLFPTELRLEAFCPPYLEAKFNNLRPTIVGPNSMSGISYGKTLTLEMEIRGKVEEKLVWITMVAPAFNTHSFSMNQRLLVLGNDKITALGESRYNIEVRTPRSGNLAPAGFYLLFVVHQDIPSMGIWVKLQ